MSRRTPFSLALNSSMLSHPLLEDLRVLQINLNHDARAQDLSLVEAYSQGAQVILSSDPYLSHGKILAPGWSSCINGQAAILVRMGIQYTKLQTPETVHLGAVQVGDLTLCSCYAPPSQPIDDTLDTLRTLLVHRTTPMVIGGDFNCRSSYVLGSSTNPRGEQFDDLIASLDLSVHNDTSITWSRMHNGTLLQAINDYTLSTSPALVREWRVLERDSLSDHRYILFAVGGTTVPRYTQCRLNPEQLQILLEEAELAVLAAGSPPEAIDQYAENLSSIVRNAMEAATTIDSRPPHVNKWWNEDLDQLRGLLRQLDYRLRRTRVPLRKAVIAEVRRHLHHAYRLAIRRCKETAWRDFCSSSEPWGKAYHSIVKRRTGGWMGEIPPHLRLPDGTNIADNGEAAAYLLDSKFPEAVAPLPPLPPSDSPITLEEGMVSVDTVSKIISCLDNRKAPGPDGVSNKALKLLHLTHPLVLPSLYSNCLTAGHFPLIWKQGRVVFLPKDGKDPASPDGYRPITLLSTIGKVFERVIQERLEGHLEAQHLLHVCQFGFRKHRSTEQAVNLAVEMVRLLRTEQKLIAMLSLDIKGAFDHVSWPIILDRLMAYRVPEYLHRLIHSYFTGRVVYFGEAERQLERGCPQGSVLGPLLWNVGFNDILSSLSSEHSSAICYADDTLLFITASNAEELGLRSRNISAKLIDFLGSRGLELNIGKTEMLLFDQRTG